MHIQTAARSKSPKANANGAVDDDDVDDEGNADEGDADTEGNDALFAARENRTTKLAVYPPLASDLIACF